LHVQRSDIVAFVVAMCNSSMRNSKHRLRTVSLKVAGSCLWMFAGDKHPKEVCLLLLIGSLFMLWCSLSRGIHAPYHGEKANQLRAALDTAIVVSYAGALGAVTLHELSRGTIGVNGGPSGNIKLEIGKYLFGGKPGEYWPLGGMVTDLICTYLPYVWVPAAVVGWGLRPCLHGWARCCCGARKGKRRVLPQPDEDAETRKKKKAREALFALDEAASLGEAEAPPIVDGAKLWLRNATMGKAAAAATTIQRRARGVAVRRQAALEKAAGPRGAAAGPEPLLLKDKGAPLDLDAPLHAVERDFEGGARGDEALHAACVVPSSSFSHSSLQFYSRSFLTLVAWCVMPHAGL
jgi:hypothetical protein